MSQLHLSCPSCHARLQLGLEADRHRVKCPGCGAVFVLSSSDGAPTEGAENQTEDVLPTVTMATDFGCRRTSHTRDTEVPAAVPTLVVDRDGTWRCDLNCPSCGNEIAIRDVPFIKTLVKGASLLKPSRRCDQCGVTFAVRFPQKSPMGHIWADDLGQSRHKMLDGFTCYVRRCAKCGCLETAREGLRRASYGRPLVYEYKPCEWTWNPFKTLKQEPPCPAHW